MEATLEHTIDKEENSKRKSSILSVLLFLLLLVALVIPIFSYQIPPPELEGVLVSFGEPERGAGNDAPAVQNEDPKQKETEASSQAEAKEEEKKEQKKVDPATAKPAAKVLTNKVEKEVVVPKSVEEKKSTNVTPSPKVDLEAQKRLEEQKAQAAAAALAAAEAKAAEEKQRQFEESKKQFGDFLSGSGKGTTNSSGNQGDPNGDPNSEILTGISTGTGRVGGGLSNRGILFEPEVKDESQKTGKIVMNVCVDTNGKVIESSFTQRGSTSVDGELREKAQLAAKKYKFSASEIEEQCGTITFDFKVE